MNELKNLYLQKLAIEMDNSTPSSEKAMQLRTKEGEIDALWTTRHSARIAVPASIVRR